MPGSWLRRGLVPILIALLTVLLSAGCGHDGEAPANSPGNQVEAEAPATEPQAEPATSPEPAADEAAPEAAEEAPAEEPAPEPPAPAGPSFGAKVLTAIKVIAIFLGKLIFVIALPAAILGTLFGMPGSVLVLVAATLYSALHGWASPPWWVLLVLGAIALAAEFAESALAVVGVRQSGASNSTSLWVLAGGFAGAVLGGLIAAPLGTVGALAGPVGWIILSIIPPIGLGMLGGYLGGYWRERRSGKSHEEARNAGWGALAGRLAGSFAKALLVAVMVTILLIASWPTLF